MKNTITAGGQAITTQALNEIPLRIFIGYDSHETVAYHVLAHSILSRATCPVSLIPLNIKGLGHLYTRGRGPTEATEFSLTRFLVPFLSGYEGWSIFMDCDMLCLTDIGKIWKAISHADWQPPAKSSHAVYVCQHNYVPKTETKFLGQQQTKYPRKNWSSFMVFNNKACEALTPRYVNSATGLELHRFAWTTDDQIGSLPLTWNWLVDEYDQPILTPEVLHYTLGGPYFDDYVACDYAAEWFAEKKAMLGETIGETRRI
jgi:hypothetical protein